MNPIDPSAWAMLARHYDEVSFMDWPRIGQPKLNGIRACWTGEHFVSRQGKVWKEETIPHLYAKLRAYSSQYPNVPLDGEFYAHGMPFQEIEKRVAVKRQRAHNDVEAIDFHAFDIISTDHTEARQMLLSETYPTWVAVCHVKSLQEANVYLNTFVEYGYEGIMLRALGCGYLAGRTDALVKLKPLRYGSATILNVTEGLGKFQGMLGAFIVKMNGVIFSVGGGNITEEARVHVWQTRESWVGRKIAISFRDFFNSGKPVQPLIVKL